MKTIGKRFVSIFAHIADCMMSMESIRDAMTLFVYILVLLWRDEICLPIFNVYSTVHEHRTDLEWSRHANKMKDIFDQTASTLCIGTIDKMKDLIDVEMTDNGRS